MAGAGGDVQPTSTFQTSSLDIDEDYSISEVLDTVVTAGENLGYEFDEKETENGFLALYGDSLEAAVGTEDEALRVKYNDEESELYVQGVTRTSMATSLTALVERELT